MKKFIVNKKYNEKKLDTFLFDNIPNLSKNLYYQTLRKKDIKINGKRIHENTIIYENDEIQVFIADKLLNNFIEPKIIFEDKNILVINKPYNIEVTGENSLSSYIQKKYPLTSPMPCHRLDRNTTGLVLYAKNNEALNILYEKFKNHEIEKHYLALVYGIPKNKFQKCEAYLFKDRKKSQSYISSSYKKGYKKIITTYTLLKQNSDNTSLLDVQIETGKTHQIRAHLAYIGLPIIGDRKIWN